MNQKILTGKLFSVAVSFLLLVLFAGATSWAAVKVGLQDGKVSKNIGKKRHSFQNFSDAEAYNWFSKPMTVIKVNGRFEIVTKEVLVDKAQKTWPRILTEPVNQKSLPEVTKELKVTKTGKSILNPRIHEIRREILARQQGWIKRTEEKKNSLAKESSSSQQKIASITPVTPRTSSYKPILADKRDMEKLSKVEGRIGLFQISSAVVTEKSIGAIGSSTQFARYSFSNERSSKSKDPQYFVPLDVLFSDKNFSGGLVVSSAPGMAG